MYLPIANELSYVVVKCEITFLSNANQISKLRVNFHGRLCKIQYITFVLPLSYFILFTLDITEHHKLLHIEILIFTKSKIFSGKF